MTRPAKQNDAIQHSLIGEVFEGVVRDVVNSGNAVLEHPSGLAVFVRGAWIGERIKVKITDIKKSFAIAVLQEVLVACVQRVESPCKHFSDLAEGCGGCAWLFVRYEAQLAAKQSWVQKSFADLLNPAKSTQLRDIVASEKTLAYRNRAEFKSDGNRLGFLAASSSELIDIASCVVLNPVVAGHLADARNLLPNPDWEQKNQGRQPKKSPQYTLIAVDDDMPLGERVINQRLPFKQGNALQNEALKHWLADVLGSCDAHSTLIELFCGAGNFTQVICNAGFGDVVAAELAGEALSRLKQKAYAGVTTHAANLFDEKELTALCHTHKSAKTLVLDPPREGLVCIEPLLRHRGLKQIAYISCDVATCARDVKRFVGAGYKIKQIQPVDMFPNTPHVELCVFLSRA